MPKKVRPYGSGVDAESAALARGRPNAGEELPSELAATMTVREIASHAAEAVGALNELTSTGTDFTSPDDVRAVIADLERIGHGLPSLCEQLARILVVQHEHGQVAADIDPDPGFWLIEVVEALAAAGQAADMMTGALDQAVKASVELRAAP